MRQGLPVDGRRHGGVRVEHHHADRRGLHQRLQPGPRAPLVAVRARIRDRHRRLRGEQHQQRLVLVGEALPALLVADEEGSDMRAAVAHRRALEGATEPQLRREPERADVAGEVVDPQRRPLLAQMLKQLEPVGQAAQKAPLLLGSRPRGDKVLRRSRLVDRKDGAVAGASERAGAVDNLAQHGGDIEARTDAPDGLDQVREALLRCRGRATRFVFLLHCSLPLRTWRQIGCNRADAILHSGPTGENPEG